MPFEEIKKPIQSVTPHISVNKSSITISKFFVNQYFKEKQKAKIFIDRKKKLIGFQPSQEGYKISNRYGKTFIIYCKQITSLLSGRFIPTWNKKLEMLVIDYGERKVAN